MLQLSLGSGGKARPFLLKLRDFFVVDEGCSDQVESGKHLVLGGRGDCEWQFFAVHFYGLIGEVNRDGSSSADCDDFGVVFCVHLSQEEAAVGRVLSEDVAEAWVFACSADNDHESGLLDGPDGVLTGGATTEVHAADENGCTLGFWLVEGEFWTAHVLKEKLAVSAAGDSAEESGGDDSVGVDLICVVDRDFAGVGREARHLNLFLHEFETKNWHPNS